MEESPYEKRDRRRWLLSLPVLLAIMAPGSGSGSGGSPTPTPTPTPIVTPVELTSDRRVASVTVEPGQSLGFGATKDIAVTVRNAAGNVLNVTAGSVFLTVVSGSQFLAATDGPGVRSVLPGTARVTATVDGISSPAANVVVTSNASVTATPESYTVEPGAQQKLTFTVADAPDARLTYQVLSGEAGAVSSDGTFTAPTVRGVYHVRATSVFDPLKSAVATITVPIVVTATPAAVTLTVTETHTFVASVRGDSSANVEWSVREGASGGTISAGGFYQAPTTPGTYHVVATSTTDRSRSATVEVSVRAGSGTVIIE